MTTLLDKADTLLIGGGMAYTFYKSMGREIGKSILEEDRVEMAGDILKKAKESSCEFLLPVDCLIADEFSNDAQTKYVASDAITGRLARSRYR